MKNRFSKLLCVILSVAMVLSMCGITVIADDDVAVEAVEESAVQEPAADAEAESSEPEAEDVTLAADDDPVSLAEEGVYYVKYGGTGNGLSPTSPVATVKDAVTKINEAGYGAGDTVTVYIMNDDTLTAAQTEGKAHGANEPWWYDANGNYFTSFVKNTVRRQTAWASRAGSAGSYTATLRIKGYTDDAKLFSSSVTGDTAHILLGGNTIFEDITIVHTRKYDVTMFANGNNNVTFNNVSFMWQDACNYSGSGTPKISAGQHRFALTQSTGSVGGMTITYNTPVPSEKDTRYGAIVANNYATTFTGHVKWYFNGASVNGQIPWGIAASKFNDGLSVVVNAGTYSNVKRDSKVTTVTGGLQIVNNNGASLGTIPAGLVSADETWYMNSADTTGNALDVTDTAGTFTVKGGNVAYIVSDDHKTIKYSVNNTITVPAGTYDVSYAADVDAIKDAVIPFEDASKVFIGWTDDGAGTLTASYRATGEEVAYYVQQGATGNGLTASTPGSFTTVVNAINANYGKDDTVTIKVVRCASDDNTTITDATEAKVNALAFPTLNGIPAHEAMLVITSADEANRSIVSFNNGFSLANDKGGNIEYSGPVTLKNIDVVDARINYRWDMYLNAHDFKLDTGVNWYRPTKSGTTYTVKGTSYTGGFGGGSRSTKTFDTSMVAEFTDGSFSNFTYFNFTGYNTSGTMTFNKDMTMKFGTGTAAAITLDYMNGVAALFKKNVNLVFNGTAATSFINRSGKTEAQMPIVEGAIQIIKNSGATLGTLSAYAYTDSSRTVKTPMYNITVANGVTLDVTETAGTYTVAGDNIAYIVAPDGFSATYNTGDTISVPAPGAYSIGSAATVEDIKTALGTPEHSPKYEFGGWSDDGNGTLTAILTETSDEEIDKYYVKYGATGTGATIDAPAGDIKTVIETINADGWGEGDNVTVYLVPTGNEPTKAQLNATGANGEAAPIKLDTANGFITYISPNAPHTATITYTTYNYDPATDNKMILANADKVASSNYRDGSAHVYICGPSVFKDLFLIDMRMDNASWDFYTQNHDFTMENVDWRKTTGSRHTYKHGYTFDAWNNHFYTGNHTSDTAHKHAPDANNTTIIDYAKLNDFSFSSSGTKAGDAVIKIGNDDTRSEIAIMAGHHGKANSVHNGSISVVLNNTTVGKLINYSNSGVTYTTTVTDLQFILNNGSTINTNTANINGNVYMLKVADGGKLDVTDEVGVYTVETDKAFVYAYAGGDKIYYAAAGSQLSIDEPGTYQIGFIDNASDVAAVFESEVAEYEFDKWVDDGAGTLTAATKPTEDDETKFYAMYGGKGDGRTPDAPAGDVAGAINSINADVAAGVLSAGQEVTVYVKSADDWRTFNSTWGKVAGTPEYEAVPYVGKTANPTTPEHHMTAWRTAGAQPAAYSVVLNVKSYDYITPSYMPSNQQLGKNESLDTNGVTKFDYINIVDTRFGYREFELHGNDTTFGEHVVIAHLDLGSAEANRRWDGKFGLDAGNVTIGTYVAGTYNNDVAVRFDNAFDMIGGDRGVFLGSSVSNASTFNGNVTLYLNNPAIKTSLQWQGSGSTGTNTFNKNLNLVFEDADKIYYRERDKAAVTINNLQMIANTDIEYFATNGTTAISPETLPANVTVYGKKWILKIESGLGNFLDVTDTAGTFTVDAGNIAVATNTETGAVTVGSTVLKLEPGIYNISKVSGEDLDDAVVVTFDGELDGNTYIVDYPFELPARANELLREFKGWTLDGGETILAAGSLYTPTTAGENLAFVSVWSNYEDTIAIYVDAVNGNDEKNGLAADSAVKTLNKAIQLADARTEGTKKVVIIGEYEYSLGMPVNTNPIVITGDGSGNSVFDLYDDCIYLGGPVKFENIKLTHTTSGGGKIMSSEGHDMSFGAGVVADSDYDFRLGSADASKYGKVLTGTFESGVFRTLEIGNFWVTNKRATAAGADVVIDGARITTVAFTSNGWMTTQLGNDFTGPVRLVVNSGYVKDINVTTQSDNAQKYAQFLDTVEILSNNGATVKIENQFTAPNGAWTVNAAAAEDGSILEFTNTPGKYTVKGEMTAIAKNTSGEQFVSIDGTLTLPAGNYTVEFVDKIEYIISNDTISFYSTCEDIDLSLIKTTQYDDKVFLGWVYENGTAPNYKDNKFVPGDVLVAKYIDYVPENEKATKGDFFIKGAQVRLSSENGNGLRYVVQMNEAFFNELTQYSASIINEENPNYGTLILPTTLTKGRSMFYNKEIPVEWARDGKIGTKENPFDVDQAHNATPVTTNSVFTKAYKPASVPAVKTFDRISVGNETAKLFTICLTGVEKNNYTNFYSVRGYIRYIDANGFERVCYTDYYQTNIYNVSSAALEAGETGDFLTEVDTYVEAKPGEGGRYDDYMAKNYNSRTLLSGYETTADKDPNHKMYKLANGLTVREVDINYSGKTNEDPVEIVHFADVHLNWINEQDLYDAYPSTLSTYRGRSWNRNGASTNAISTAMEYASFYDQAVLTGDIMDYFSWGCAEIMHKLIVDRDKDVLIAMGNHEPAELMQNDANTGTHYNGRTDLYPLLQDIWHHNIYYTSKIITNDDGIEKAMCVVLNNEQDVYIAEQGTKLAADVEIAREKGIPIFIFEHDPICSNNPDQDPVWFFYQKGDWAWMKWDSKNATHANFPHDADGYILATKYDPAIHDAMGLTPYDINGYGTKWVNCTATNAQVPGSSEWYSKRGAGKSSSDAVTKEVYNVIVTNSDVIRGVFCGHVHDHMYMEIKASYTDKNGNTVQQNIPQYIVTANAYNSGNVIKIKVW